jgi:asparagine synthase (glutamine-hydrolysing)
LSGLGGDELLGSYSSFQEIPRLVRLCSGFTVIPGFGSGFRFLTAPFMKHLTSPKYAGLFEYGGSFGGAYLLRRAMYMPWELSCVLDADMLQAGLRELRTVARLEHTVEGVTRDYHKVSALEMSWYMRGQLLRDADWASMAHSLEVRVPFLELELLRSVAPLLGRQYSPDKRSVAMAVGNLPDEVINRGKTGFSVPVREWIIEDEGHTGERGLRGWAGNVYRQTSV